MRDHVSGALVAGLILVLTGFAPDHWAAEAIRALRFPENLVKPSGIDLRLVLVALAVAIIGADVWFRNKRHAAADLGRADPSAVEPRHRDRESVPEKPVLPFPTAPR